MKKQTIISTLFAGIIILSSACSSTKKLTAPESLYKSDKGKEIAYSSYDSALTLWKCSYTEEFVDTDFGRTHLLIAGNESSEPIFVIPGLFGDATMWYPNVATLSQQYRVFVLDMINYGGKGQPFGRAITEESDYVTWITQLMDHYNISRVSLCGVSYSSWLSLAVAREIPSRIASLILLDPSETFMPMNGGIAWKGFKAFMIFPNRNKYDRFFTWIGGGYRNEEMSVWFEHMLDVIEYGSVGMMDVPMHHTFEAAGLKMITMPVLVMAGGKPILYKDPEEFRANALAAIPHAEVEIVPGTGHGLNMEKPEVVNSRILEFLEELY